MPPEFEPTQPPRPTGPIHLIAFRRRSHGLLAARLLDDPNTRAGANPGRACRDQGLQTLEIAPAAFTPTSSPTTRRISATSATVAPPDAKPVDVFTKSAPAALASVDAVTFSSSLNSAASMMTLLSTPDSRHGAVTASRSRSTSR